MLRSRFLALYGAGEAEAGSSSSLTPEALAPAALAHVQSGRRADGGAVRLGPLLEDLGATRARVGYVDLCWSADKSVSLAWAMAPTEAERNLIAQAHKDAVASALRSVEAELGQARRGKARIEFTAREFDLLRYFVQHTGQVVTREQILNEVWGYEEFPTTRTIDNFVAKLRQKIERSPHAPEHILTIHGSGYKFVG